MCVCVCTHCSVHSDFLKRYVVSFFVKLINCLHSCSLLSAKEVGVSGSYDAMSPSLSHALYPDEGLAGSLPYHFPSPMNIPLNLLLWLLFHVRLLSIFPLLFLIFSFLCIFSIYILVLSLSFIAIKCDFFCLVPSSLCGFFYLLHFYFSYAYQNG